MQNSPISMTTCQTKWHIAWKPRLPECEIHLYRWQMKPFRRSHLYIIKKIHQRRLVLSVQLQGHSCVTITFGNPQHSHISYSDKPTYAEIASISAQWSIQRSFSSKSLWKIGCYSLLRLDYTGVIHRVSSSVPDQIGS